MTIVRRDFATLAAPGFFDGAVRRILELQRPDGSIPWYNGGVIDAWNHTHAAMGLSIAGRIREAEQAYEFLAHSQLPDGSWWGQYGSAVPLDTNKYEGTGNEPRVRDTNYCAYPATGVLHHFLITGDRAFLKRMWPVVRASMGFVLQFQSEHGEIRWSAPDPATPQDDALLAGSSSIHKSLECAVRLGQIMGEDTTAWHRARMRLADAVRAKPYRFDRQWEKKDYFSMDWYYPVLGGVYRGDPARRRLASRWNEFVTEGKGCRCVLNQPWVTIAESCELALALIGVNEVAKAHELWSAQHQWRDADGAYWMGWHYEENEPWPHEKPAWTSAAVLIAADSLSNTTPAARILCDVTLEETAL